MIIDLSIPRLVITNKINEVIFNAKMKGYSLNRRQIAAVFTVAMILGYNEHTFACEGARGIDESLKQNIYAMIFALIETFKSCTLSDFNNIVMYFNKVRVK